MIVKMAKRKNFFQKTFGKKIGLSDIILLIIILGYPIYIIVTEGFKTLFTDFADNIWVGVVIFYIATLLVRRAKR